MPPSIRKQSAFIKKCAGIDGFSYYLEDDHPDDQFEDDGALHIIKNGERAIFDIGQDTPSKEANEKTTRIMTALGLKKKISERVLVDETEEDDEYCPHCGRGGQ